MEITGNKYLDVLIPFVFGGGIGATFNLFWLIITGRLDWQKKKIELEILELDAQKKIFDLVEYMKEKNRDKERLLNLAETGEIAKADLISQIRKQNTDTEKHLRSLISADLRKTFNAHHHHCDN